MLFSQKLLRIRKKWHFFILDPRHLFFSQKKQQKNGFSWQHSGAGGRPSAAFLDWIHRAVWQAIGPASATRVRVD